MGGSSPVGAKPWKAEQEEQMEAAALHSWDGCTLPFALSDFCRLSFIQAALLIPVWLPAGHHIPPSFISLLGLGNRLKASQFQVTLLLGQAEHNVM